MSAKTGMTTGLLGAGTRERRIGRPAVPLAAPIAALAAAGATWYGFVAQAPGHPAARPAGALPLAAGGPAAALLARPGVSRAAEPAPGGSSGWPAGAEGSRTAASVLALLSMATALIHFAAIEKHRARVRAVGRLHHRSGLARFARAVITPTAPTRLPVWHGTGDCALPPWPGLPGTWHL